MIERGAMGDDQIERFLCIGKLDGEEVKGEGCVKEVFFLFFMKKKIMVMNMVEVLDVKWFSDVNRIKVKCECGNVFWVRVDRWWSKCNDCGRSYDIKELRKLC